MKPRRLGLATFFVFVFIVGFDWLLHGVLLKGLYESTPQMWRTQAQMPDYFPYLTGAQLLLAVILGLVFRQGYQGRGLSEGLRFGVLMGLLLAPIHITWYAVQPISGRLASYWVAGGIVEMLAVGTLFALFCRPNTELTS